MPYSMKKIVYIVSLKSCLIEKSIFNSQNAGLEFPKSFFALKTHFTVEVLKISPVLKLAEKKLF